MQKYIPYIFHVHALHFAMLQPARNFSGICSETPGRCVRSASIDTVFPPSPWRSPLYRSAKQSPPNHLLVSFAFSWLVRSYVGLLSSSVYAVYYRNQSKKLPLAAVRIPGTIIFSRLRILHNCCGVGIAEAFHSRRGCVPSSISVHCCCA